ncbi:MAG TPA: ABC transporter substrate-binding protein [Actinomycetota bacterium]|jgi:ABC-type branched-subunit amino acid transport system substrate-binding protein|nr:ABC transporter substrate-binding protein [Actinomycetota bacterium]
MNRRQAISVSVVMLWAIVAAACGTTVPLSQQRALERTSGGQGLALDGNTDLGPGLGSSGAAGSLPGSRTGFRAGASGLPSGGGTGPGGVAASGVNGPGITDKTIKIGIGYAPDAAQANAALGASGATQIDTKTAYDTLVKDLNARGGIGGRKVAVVYHEYSLTGAEPYDQQDQAACTKWTQDDPVFITDGGLNTDTFLACMEKAGAISGIFMDSLRSIGKLKYRQFPHYLQPRNIDLEDLQTLKIDSLGKMGCFNGKPKIGLVSIDTPHHRRAIKDALLPALRKRGLSLSESVYVRDPESPSETGSLVSEITNAAVRFNSAGVTHVIFTDAGAGIAFFFMQSAEKQAYRPRYCLDGGSGNQGLADLLAQTGSVEQLNGALSIAWMPSIDTRPEDLPAWAKTAEQERCYEVMRKAGVTMDSGNAKGLAELACDTVWLIEAILNRTGSVLNQDTFLQGLQRLGADYPSAAGAFVISLSATKHDGLGTVANMKYISDCTCFRYTSRMYPVVNTD